MRIKVIRADGTEGIHDLTPAVEYTFELTHKKSFYKAFREEEMQTHLYWVAWELIRRSGETVKPFGMEFIETVKSVEVLPDDPNG